MTPLVLPVAPGSWGCGALFLEQQVTSPGCIVPGMVEGSDYLETAVR